MENHSHARPAGETHHASPLRRWVNRYSGIQPVTVIILLSVKQACGRPSCRARLVKVALDARATKQRHHHHSRQHRQKQSGRKSRAPDLGMRSAPSAELAASGPVIQSAGTCVRANSIVNWFAALFAELGIEGCSSHSGRRTFITTAARRAHRAGCSLRDVQLLAGHRSIETTQGYIDGDTDGQRRLISLL